MTMKAEIGVMHLLAKVCLKLLEARAEAWNSPSQGPAKREWTC